MNSTTKVGIMTLVAVVLLSYLVFVIGDFSFSEKGYNYPNFSVGHKKYRICYEENKDYYYIEEIVEEDDED